MSNIFEFSNKDTRSTSDASIVNFEYISHFTVNIAEFEQINNAGWTWEIVVSDNKFVFSNCEKYTVLWARWFHIYST